MYHSWFEMLFGRSFLMNLFITIDVDLETIKPRFGA